MKHTLLTLLSICHFFSVSAVNDIRFKHLEIKDGLSDSEINHITKDSRGFMWISTGYGLNRFDGYTFKAFTRNSKDPYSLPANFVENVQEDIHGFLWVRISRQGYTCYDPYKETFHPAAPLLSEQYGIPENPSYLYIDKEKNIWSHSENGTYFYNIKEQQLTFFPIEKTLREKEIYLSCITEDKNGILFLYSNGYFERTNRQTNQITYRNDYLTSISGNSPTKHSLFVDADGDYWIYTSSQIRIYHAQEDRWENLSDRKDSRYVLTGNYINDIKKDNKDQIWIALDHGGINIINKKNGTVQYIENDLADENSLIQNTISCLYCDETGGMWTGSYKRGISYYHESIFKFRTDHLSEFNTLKNFTPDVNAIVEDKQANLWIGTSNGLIHINRKTNERNIYRHTPGQNSLSGDIIVSMLETKDRKIWIGTFRDGLNVFDGRTFTNYRHHPEDPASLANNHIWALAEDNDGYIWIGTLGSGLQGVDPRTGKFTQYHQPDGKFSNEYVRSICIGRDNNIYIATTQGITVYSPTTKTFEKWLGNRTGTQEFSHENINHIYEDSRGLLWVATAEGLNILDRKKDEIITPVNDFSLGSEIIRAIVEDNNKNMWITTTSGISNIIVSSDPTTETHVYTCHRYDGHDGLRDQQFNTCTITKTQNGEIIAGGVRGISLFYPEQMRYNNHTPKVEFTELQLFNKEVKIDSIYDGNCILTQPLNYTSGIKLKHSQNVFSISFSAMNYILPEKTQYLYKLEGVNSDWLTADTNKLTYTNLAPGKYTLQVKAINSDGFINHETSELKIVITPPFWASPAAYVLYLLLFIGILLLTRKYIQRNERHKYKLAQIKQEAQQKHEIDDMKLRFFTNISHELRTPLTLIISPLENVIKHTDNKDQKNRLEMIHRNAIRLLTMVNQLLDFRKMDVKAHALHPTRGDIVDFIRNVGNSFGEYSEKKNIHLFFTSTIKELFIVFDEDKMNKIIMNLLSNAFKFTPEGGRVDVSLDLQPAKDELPEQLIIKISDTGIGISNENKDLIFQRFFQIQDTEGPKSSGSGIGLHLVKEFVTLHQGTITVHDNIGRGSVFMIAIPVIHGNVQQTTPLQPGEINDESSPENLPDISGTTGDEQKSTPLILIVDDNDDFRLFMKDSLQNTYHVHEAPDGRKAWEIIPDLQPDIIISDVMMPETDGNELCKRVKTDIRTSHIPFILLTARSAKEHKLEGLENGADDYITKPFDFDIVALRIKNLLKLRQKRQENFNRQIEVTPSEITITSLDEKLIQKAIQYVENNLYRTELSVEELSTELAMSRVHLYKKMLSITGKTPTEFIRTIRLKRAAQLLRESQQSISEIAYQTGFSHPKYFRKHFKEEFGTLPSEYQQKKGNLSQE